MSTRAERPVRAWHFTASPDRLRDGSLLPRVGEWLVHEGPCEMCHSGLHASLAALDALSYAPGQWVHRVECRGVELEHDGKLLCFALDVVHLWEPPEVVLDYLRTGNRESRAAAGDAARDAARDPQGRRLLRMLLKAHREAA